MKNHLAPKKWYEKSDVRVLLWGIVFLALLSLWQTQSQLHLMKLFGSQSERQTEILAENIRTSVLKLVEVAEQGGGFIDSYLDTLDLSEGYSARIIHSPSIDAEYGVEEEENPRLNIERETLSDGLPRRWEEGDFLHSLSPLKAKERCRPCHHLPDGSGEQVPLDYTLGLLEFTVPVKAQREAKEETRRLIFGTFLFLCFMVGLFLFGIFRILKELQEREEIIREISASAQDAILMIDNAGKIIFWNRAAEKIFGYRQDEALFRNAGELIAPPRFYDDFRRGMASLQRTGKGAPIGKIIEYPALRKDGTEFLAEHSISAVKIQGKWCAVGIVRDVTEKNKAEDVLKREKERAQKYLDVAGVMLIVLTADEKVALVNKKGCEILGYEVEEILGKNWFENFLPEKTCAEVREVFRKLASGEIEGVEYYENTVLTKGGREKLILWHNASLWDEEGNFLCLSSGEDITKRKKMERALRERNANLKKALKDLEKAQGLLVRQEKLASVGTLAAGVAHEILNPLNIISATVQMMQMEEATEEQKQNFREIMTQIHRAAKITNSLRMFSHNIQPEIREVDVNALFEKTVSLMEYDLSLENIIVERKEGSSLPPVEGDEDLLAQVFMNLLTNARDAMRGGKNNRILFHSRKVNGGIEIRLSDTGPGIPEAIRDKIFDPFFTTKEPNQGTGLGLSVLHSIITEKHGGSVRVESEEGKGTAFVITLPGKRG